MLARCHTFAIDGLTPRSVAVEVDIRPGLPSFTMVGLGDAAVREARERVRAAVLNSGFAFPMRRVTVNLAPAHLRKVGPGFDLAIAVAILAAGGQVPPERLEGWAVFGELSLGGEVRPCRGVLAVAEGARRSGLAGLILAHEQGPEAALVDGVRIAPIASLRAAAELLDGGRVPQTPTAPPHRDDAGDPGLDLADVRGQPEGVRALEVAAAGGHNLLLEGPPGTGKTMLARRLPSILPPLTREEAIEVTRVHSVAGVHRGRGLVASRPFRAPHHAVSVSGLVGGGGVPVPGEASLAHHGVLFLDELSEFSRSTLEALRQPLEDGRVSIVRGQSAAVFPTRFVLLAATNPCPCGYAGARDRDCTCTESDLARHRRRLSGPLLDRLDLLVAVQRPTAEELEKVPLTRSVDARARVMAARERQQHRFRGSTASCNAHMDPQMVRVHVRLDDQGERMLRRAYDRYGLSARGHGRILRVARTVADLAASPRVRAEHLRRAIDLRQHDSAEQAA